MPNSQIFKSKQKTRVPKILGRKFLASKGRLKETELPAHGRAKHITGASPAGNLCGNQSRGEKLPHSNFVGRGDEKVTSLYIPVVSSTGIPLMPCHPARVRELVRKNKAIRRFKSGIFYIQMTDVTSNNLQKVVCGIDPGSKREGFTVKSSERTFINVLSNAVDTVKDKLKTRREMRRARRNRKTPCRKNRQNRACLKRNRVPPSTKARWDAKLRIINILRSIFPISEYVIEDIKAKTEKGKKKWNISFSPLEVGKTYFYNKIAEFGNLIVKQGHETAKLREELGLVKIKAKLADSFWAHNVDSWVLANSSFSRENEELKHKYPENIRMYKFEALNFARRQLHVLQPGKAGKRREYGGTISLGIVKGTVVKHRKKRGLCYVGGNSKGRISVHDIGTGIRIAQNIKVGDIEELYKTKWRVQFLPCLKAGVSLHN